MSGNRAAITVNRPREEVERLWQDAEHGAAERVTFRDAPGDRGTEIHVEVDTAGKLGGIAQKLKGSDARAKAMDELRRFKQVVETGVIARSEGTPEGERADRKLKQRPAQPLDNSEREKAGV